MFRVGKTHVPNFTLFFSYMLHRMYVYVHVPKCRCHGTCVKVGEQPQVLGFLFCLWDSLLAVHCCILQAGRLTSFWEFPCLCFPSYHRSAGITALCYCDQLLYGLLIFKLRSSCWSHRCFTHWGISLALHSMSFEDKCVSCLYFIVKTAMISFIL